MSLGGILTDLDGFTGSLAGTLVPNSGGNIVDLRSEQNLAAWYDASNSANLTVDSVGRVSQWNDTSTFASRHLTQATAGSQPIYLPWSGQNYGYCPGVAANYFSTPDSAAVSITGDIDLRAKVALTDWTPATANTLISKWGSAGFWAYIIQITPTGQISLSWSTNGITVITANSTASVPFSDRQTGWVRAALDVDNGSAGNTVRFYTSSDGVTWTQLGADVVTASVTSIVDTAISVVVGINLDGGIQPLDGYVFYAEIRNGINGTVVAAFDPSRATDGASSFVAATGETWTTNTSGSKPAQIVGRASVMFDGVDDFMQATFAVSNPTSLYFVLNPISWSATDAICDGISSDTMHILQQTSSPNVDLIAGAPLFAAQLPLPVGTTSVFPAIFNGASTRVARNRLAATTGTTGATGGTGLTLAAYGNGLARFGNFKFSAVAMFSAAHDARTQARVVNYLVSKYSIPV